MHPLRLIKLEPIVYACVCVAHIEYLKWTLQPASAYLWGAQNKIKNGAELCT